MYLLFEKNTENLLLNKARFTRYNLNFCQVIFSRFKPRKIFRFHLTIPLFRHRSIPQLRSSRIIKYLGKSSYQDMERFQTNSAYISAVILFGQGTFPVIFPAFIIVSPYYATLAMATTMRIESRQPKMDGMSKKYRFIVISHLQDWIGFPHHCR